MHILLTLSILFQLDTAVMQRADYIQRRTEQIELATRQFSMAAPAYRYEVARQVWNLYYAFNNDSAIVWAEKGLEQARLYGSVVDQQRATIAYAQCLSVSGEYEGALHMLQAIAPQLSPELEAEYYKALSLTYIWQSQFSTIPSVRDSAQSRILPLRDSILRIETDPIWRVQEQALICIEEQPEVGIALLRPLMDSLPAESDYIRYLSNTLGSCYQRLYWRQPSGAYRDSSLYYYAVSALSDMQHGVMEHASLREVALILYRSGDIERAYHYMNCCIQDAQLSKARLRTIEMAGDMPLILSTYRDTLQAQQARQHRMITWLSISAGILGILLIVVLLLIIRWQRINRRLTDLNAEMQHINEALSAANEQLLNTNGQLQESNRIRDTYVTRYMTECSAIIESMTQYQKSLLRISLSDQPKQLFQMVRSTDVIDRTLHDFYQRFDETFLSLFPHFIDRINAMLRPEEAFAQPTSSHLTTELRIYALIRLGITDSGDIARFLRLSEKTVQNYRAVVRNRALGDRNLLEQQITQLGPAI